MTVCEIPRSVQDVVPMILAERYPGSLARISHTLMGFKVAVPVIDDRDERASPAALLSVHEEVHTVSIGRTWVRDAPLLGGSTTRSRGCLAGCVAQDASGLGWRDAAWLRHRVLS